MAALLLLVAVACGSSSAPADSAAAGAAPAGKRFTKPRLDLVEITGPRTTNEYLPGPIQVQYELRMENRDADLITLRRVEVQSIGSGPYQLRPDGNFFTFNHPVTAGGKDRVTFWARANLSVRSIDPASSEPVTLRVTATFDSAQGAFKQVFMKNLSQFPTQ